MLHNDCKPGIVVLYSPVIGGPNFIGVVREVPWQMLCGTWVTTLFSMEPAYGEWVGVPGKKIVRAASLDHISFP